MLDAWAIACWNQLKHRLKIIFVIMLEPVEYDRLNIFYGNATVESTDACHWQMHVRTS